LTDDNRRPRAAGSADRLQPGCSRRHASRSGAKGSTRSSRPRRCGSTARAGPANVADLAAALKTSGKHESPSKAGALRTSTDLLEPIRLAGGSSKPVMVEVAGIEPASNGTACRASPGAAPCGLLGPSVVGSNCAAGPSCCSMSHPGPQPARSVSLLSTRPSRPETLRGPRLHWLLSSESELSAIGTCVFRRGD